jgi:hypothetical protein
MANKVDVKRIEFSRRNDCVHDLVRACVGTFLRDQTDAPKNAKDMRVERKYVFVTGEKQSASDSFRSDPAKAFQKVDRGFGRKIVQKTQIERSALFF